MKGKLSIKEYKQYVREIIEEIRANGDDLSITDILEIVKEWISDNKSQWYPGSIAKDENCKKVNPNADNAVYWNTLDFFAKVDHLMAEDPKYYDDQLIEHAKWALALGFYNSTLKNIIEISSYHQKDEIRYAINELDRDGLLGNVIYDLENTIRNTNGY